MLSSFWVIVFRQNSTLLWQCTKILKGNQRICGELRMILVLQWMHLFMHDLISAYLIDPPLLCFWQMKNRFLVFFLIGFATSEWILNETNPSLNLYYISYYLTGSFISHIILIYIDTKNHDSNTWKTSITQIKNCRRFAYIQHEKKDIKQINCRTI